MGSYVNIFIQSVFVDNMIFAFFLGMCSYLAVSKTVKTSFGLGVAVTFVMTITVPVNYLLDKYILRAGALTWLSESLGGVDLSFLSFIIFIAVVAAIVQIVEMVVERFSPALYNSLGIFLPLIAVNCAILGASLFMQERGYANIGEATCFALGSGVGWFWPSLPSPPSVRSCAIAQYLLPCAEWASLLSLPALWGWRLCHLWELNYDYNYYIHRARRHGGSRAAAGGAAIVAAR